MKSNLYKNAHIVITLAVIGIYGLLFSLTTYFKFNLILIFLILALVQGSFCLFCFKLIRNLYIQANRDVLTGLWNRKYFYSILSELDFNSTISLILIDIDNFKRVNDKYGHTFGDKVLKETAKILNDNIRKNDIIARWGGEEFVIILPFTDSSEAYKIARRVKNAVSSQRLLCETNNRITISIGLATKNEGVNITKEGLFNFADSALCKAKEKKNYIVVYNET